MPPAAQTPTVQVETPVSATQPPELQATATLPPAEPIRVSLLYPTAEHQIEMGQSIRLVAQVQNLSGERVNNAMVFAVMIDPNGAIMGQVNLTVGEDGVYRSETWTLPHRTTAGEWTVHLGATANRGGATDDGHFTSLPSTSEVLLERYGFWLDAPRLKNIVPTLMAERGDIHNGMIRWGGAIPAQHVLPANWVDVHWRSGRYPLETAEDVRAFMLGEIGEINFSTIREIGPFERTTFQGWDAWKVGGRGQVKQDQVEWMVFYVPEVDKTFLIGTDVVQPPTGIDAHQVLRASFAVDPGVMGISEPIRPLVRLTAGPELIGPELGAAFTGPDQKVTLTWQPLQELAEDEYYQVDVDFNYIETNTLKTYATRETQFTLPADLYTTPNCEVFNWKVTLMRQTGVGEDGQPVGEPISYPSLYRYVFWRYPPGERPFSGHCPNAQW
jgi:hypothetical protein